MSAFTIEREYVPKNGDTDTFVFERRMNQTFLKAVVDTFVFERRILVYGAFFYGVRGLLHRGSGWVLALKFWVGAGPLWTCCSFTNVVGAIFVVET